MTAEERWPGEPLASVQLSSETRRAAMFGMASALCTCCPAGVRDQFEGGIRGGVVVRSLVSERASERLNRRRGTLVVTEATG